MTNLDIIEATSHTPQVTVQLTGDFQKKKGRGEDNIERNDDGDCQETSLSSSDSSSSSWYYNSDDEVMHAGEDDAKIISLMAAPPEGREACLLMRLEQCSKPSEFLSNNKKALQEREAKTAALHDLICFFGTDAGKDIFHNIMVQEGCTKMIRMNICRPLTSHRNNTEISVEDRLDGSGSHGEKKSAPPALQQPLWPHLKLVYRLLYRLVTADELVLATKKSPDGLLPRDMCREVIRLFDSEDSNERRCLRLLIHSVYSNSRSVRGSIKSAIEDTFMTFVYDQYGQHNGIKELLDFYFYIINGYSVPLKTHNLFFLKRVLIPLHQHKDAAIYHRKLVECMLEVRRFCCSQFSIFPAASSILLKNKCDFNCPKSQHTKKDIETAPLILRSLIRIWPWLDPSKQILFIGELERLVQVLNPGQCEILQNDFSRFLSRLVRTDHYHLLIRALSMWQIDNLVEGGFLGERYATTILPCIYPSLIKVSFYWQTFVGVR